MEAGTRIEGGEVVKANLTGQVVYLSGKISNDPDFKRKFKEWEMHVFSLGARKVLNPAHLPDGWDYDEYMEHCMVMVRRCDVIALLPCWSASKGAQAESAYAFSIGKQVLHLSSK